MVFPIVTGHWGRSTHKSKVAAAATPFSDDKSLDFDGTSEYLRSLTEVSIGIVNAWSIQMWVYPRNINTTARETLMFISQSVGSHNFISIDQRGDVAGDPVKVEVNPSDGSGSSRDYEYDGLLTADTWQHLVCTWNGTNLILYKDASVIAEDNTPANTPTQIDTNRRISLAANFGTSQYFDCIMYNVALWSSVLGSTEVTSLYNSGNPQALDLNTAFGNYSSQGNLKHWWVMGQSTDATYTVGTTYHHDRVSSGAIDLSTDANAITDADISSTVPS